MAQPNLKLAPRPGEEPTRQQIAMAEIMQTWREWRKDFPWQPYSDPEIRQPVLRVGATLDRSQYLVVSEPHVPLWRRILRRLKG